MKPATTKKSKGIVSRTFLSLAGKLLLVAAIVCIFLSGCEKADIYITDPQTNFEALWKIIDEHYCFFEYKDVDWNDVYRRYQIHISDTMDRYRLFDVLGDMLAELKDGHTNLISSFNLARYWDWYENYPRNFNEDVHRIYIKDCNITPGGIRYLRMSSNKIGYMYYESFSNAVGDAQLNEIFLYFKDCEGIIIDVRENGGGSLSNVDRIASRFLKEKITTGYIIHKTGPEHNDFSDLYPITLSPSEYIRWLRPVVVLTNRHSYSATNDFVNKMRILSHVTIMGDRTGGGSGLPFNSELPNGWRVRFSASPILDVNKQITEDGIEPDIRVDLLQTDLAKGKDTIIEAAIQFINSQQK